MSDRYLAIDNAKYIQNNMAGFYDEIEFKQGGIIQKRAEKVLNEATDLLKVIETTDIFDAIEKGTFAGIKRMKDGGKGLQGVVKKEENYQNPILDQMVKHLRGENNGL